MPDKILKEAKVNVNYWQRSCNLMLVFGENYFERTALLSLSSPFTYKDVANGGKTREEILKIYREAIDFALENVSYKLGVKNLYHQILQTALDSRDE